MNSLRYKEAFLSIGSNIGNSDCTIISAINRIGQEYAITDISKLYETSPQDYSNQENFLNCVVSILLPPDRSPDDLLQFLHSVESDHGRNRAQEIPRGPRRLDIDIIFFARRVINSANIQIPHPRYRHRKFVLVPLLDIAPSLVDPQSAVCVGDYAKNLHNDASQRVILRENDRFTAIRSQLIRGGYD